MQTVEQRGERQPVMMATKGKLYGSKLDAVARVGGQCRAVWNLFIAENIARYEAEGKFIFFTEMSARISELIKTDPRMQGMPWRAAGMTVRKLDRALKDCSRSKVLSRKGFPQFKRHTDRSDSFQFPAQQCKFESGRIRLPNIGWLRVRGLALPDNATPKMVALTQEPTGWHASVQYEGLPKDRPVPCQGVVGIDLGLTHLATLSDGTRIPHPRLVRKSAKRIRRLQRERCRRQKGSVNRRRTIDKLAVAYRAVANVRSDAMHKATRKLVDTYSGFVVEDLSVRGLMRTRMAGSLADAGLGAFVKTLRYKAEWAGRSWHVHGRFVRSTGVCPDCNHVGPKLGLSIRSWPCDSCGSVHDRDVAAARVILGGAVGQVLPEPAAGMPRKRGAADRGGGSASAGSSCGGPPSNGTPRLGVIAA
jgi:putative transposase